MADHRQLQELLAVYRELNATQKAQVDEHVAHCAECQTTLAAYRTLDRVVRGHLQTQLQWVTAQPAFNQQPRFAAALATPATLRTPWLDDLLFRFLQPRPLTLRLATATALLLLVMAFSTLFGGWLSFEQPVLASTPTHAAAQATVEMVSGQKLASTDTPTVTPTTIGLLATRTPMAFQ